MGAGVVREEKKKGQSGQGGSLGRRRSDRKTETSPKGTQDGGRKKMKMDRRSVIDRPLGDVPPQRQVGKWAD